MKARIALVAALVLLMPGVIRAADKVVIQCADPSGPPTTLCEVYADPDIHHGSLGTVLFHATSAVKATVTLPAGDHKIAVRASAKTSLGTNTSVIVYGYGASCPIAGWRQLGYQAWWSDPGQDPTFESRHAHVDGLCWPVNNVIVNGPQSFSWTIQLHNQPAGAKFTRFRIDDFRPGSSSGTRLYEQTTGLPQPDSSGNVAPFAMTFSYDLSKLTTGRHEWRFGIYVTQPNGKVQLMSSRSEIAVRGTSPSYRSNSSYPILQGNGGWYTNADYIDARFDSILP